MSGTSGYMFGCGGGGAGYNYGQFTFPGTGGSGVILLFGIQL